MKESVFVSKLNVLIIFGGDSQEHSISEKSAESIFKNISKEKYNIYAAGITKNGTWYLYSGDTQNISDCKWEKNINNKQIYFSTDNNIIIKNNNDFEKIKIDVAVPVLHGKNGEDGTVAALFQLAGIPQVTTTMTSAANSMDKVLTKLICERAGIPQAAWTFVYRRELTDPDQVVAKIEAALPYPIFVKPASAGSSVGISKCHNREELLRGLSAAAEHDFKIVLEETVVGREVEIAVLGNHDPVVSVVGEYTDINAKKDPHVSAYSYLTWGDINNLIDSQKIEIGNHTYDLHSIKTERKGCAKLPHETNQEYVDLFTADIGRLQSEMIQNTGFDPIVFAYPFGSISAESLPILKDFGIMMTLTCYEKPNYITRDPDCLFGINRYNRSGFYSTEEFMQKITSE